MLTLSDAKAVMALMWPLKELLYSPDCILYLSIWPFELPRKPKLPQALSQTDLIGLQSFDDRECLPMVFRAKDQVFAVDSPAWHVIILSHSRCFESLAMNWTIWESFKSSALIFNFLALCSNLKVNLERKTFLVIVLYSEHHVWLRNILNFDLVLQKVSSAHLDHNT